MGTIDLIKPPKQVFGCSVEVVATRIVREVIDHRRPREFPLEKIDLIKEENDACSHEPSRIDDRVKEDQTFHHAILYM